MKKVLVIAVVAGVAAVVRYRDRVWAYVCGYAAAGQEILAKHRQQAAEVKS